MSGAEYFSDNFAINAYMDSHVKVNIERAIRDHKNIQKAFEDAGIEVIKVPPPKDCQDGVYAANWALCRDDKAVLSSLPKKRIEESSYAEQALKKLGKTIIKMPYGVKFSGQGDALPCGNYLFVGSHYRTDADAHKVLADELGYEVIGLQTVPLTDDKGKEVINKITGWPDSFFYDIDLALSIIKKDLIAWCPEAFTPESKHKIHDLDINKIEVTLDEAVNGFACNLVSTGETVIMSEHAPLLATQLAFHGLKIITPEVRELQKGGGFIRCAALTI
jgi:N-dimethylarginine dimethylaminohydrolase